MDKKSKSVKERNLFTKARPKWRMEAEERDYRSAYDFLTLLMDEEIVEINVQMLRDQSGVVARRAKDLLRASNLPLLSRVDEYIARNLHEISEGKKLSPALCLRGNPRRGFIIADGYHRICASYYCDPDADILLKLV